MKKHRRLIVVAAVAGAIVSSIVVIILSSREPTHGGKKLSVWLDELSALQFPREWDPQTEQVMAVRAIGTNAIPWLLREYRAADSRWQWRGNQLLGKQSLIKYRFPDSHTRLRRATVGFQALGELAEPAIPALMKLVEDKPGYVPSALAGIGPPAIPALQQCLTNVQMYPTSVGQIAPIPNNTIGAIYNAIQAGRLSNSHAAIFLPAVRDWAQSTNRNPAVYNSAAMFLQDFDR